MEKNYPSGYSDDNQIQLHFSECYDEMLFIDEIEATELLDDLRLIINDETRSVRYRLQKVIDEITTTL